MEDYRQDQERQYRNSRLAGAGLAVVMSAILGTGLALDGYTYLDPPPPDVSLITLDFEEDKIEKPKPPKQHRNGTRPTVENPDPKKDVELVQQSKSPIEGKKANLAEESTVDNVGDVEVPEPPREEPVQKKYLFSNAKNPEAKDTLAMQTSSDPSFELKEGHASGNIKEGEATRTPNAKLHGRSVIGALPAPDYNPTGDGTVVVKIKVDRNGKVIEVQPGETGTDLMDNAAWAAAKEAAMKTQFTMKNDAPEFQYGTITYIFKITQ